MTQMTRVLCLLVAGLIIAFGWTFLKLQSQETLNLELVRNLKINDTQHSYLMQAVKEISSRPSE